MNTKGTIPQPSVTMSNLFGAGNLLVDDYDGLVGALLVRIMTLHRFLDDGNTPDGNAYITRDKFAVAQKTSHTAVSIVFKLAALWDLEGTQLPRRQILRDVCTHTYRYWDPSIGTFNYSKATCPYTGGAAIDTNNNWTDYPHDQCLAQPDRLPDARFRLLPRRCPRGSSTASAGEVRSYVAGKASAHGAENANAGAVAGCRTDAACLDAGDRGGGARSHYRSLSQRSGGHGVGGPVCAPRQSQQDARRRRGVERRRSNRGVGSRRVFPFASRWSAVPQRQRHGLSAAARHPVRDHDVAGAGFLRLR